MCCMYLIYRRVTVLPLQVTSCELPVTSYRLLAVQKMFYSSHPSGLALVPLTGKQLLLLLKLGSTPPLPSSRAWNRSRRATGLRNRSSEADGNMSLVPMRRDRPMPRCISDTILLACTLYGSGRISGILNPGRGLFRRIVATSEVRARTPFSLS